MSPELLELAAHARTELCTGRLRGTSLLAVLNRVPYRERDAWLDAVFELPPPPQDMPNLPRGAVPYLPCPVDAILDVIANAKVRPSDVFVDLGAGLGRVTLLVHLLSGATALGIELQPHLVELARAKADALSISKLRYVTADAAEVDLSEGTIFFSYASLGRVKLQRVLEQLVSLATRRPLVLCAVGFDLPDTSRWIPRRQSHADVTLYDSR